MFKLCGKSKLKQMHLCHDTRAKECCKPITLLPIICKVFWDLDGPNLLRLYFVILVSTAKNVWGEMRLQCWGDTYNLQLGHNVTES